MHSAEALSPLKYGSRTFGIKFISKMYKKTWELGKVKLQVPSYGTCLFFLNSVFVFWGIPYPDFPFRSFELQGMEREEECYETSVSWPKEGGERGFFGLDDSAQSLPSFPYRPSPPFLFLDLLEFSWAGAMFGKSEEEGFKNGGGGKNARHFPFKKFEIGPNFPHEKKKERKLLMLFVSDWLSTLC